MKLQIGLTRKKQEDVIMKKLRTITAVGLIFTMLCGSVTAFANVKDNNNLFQAQWVFFRPKSTSISGGALFHFGRNGILFRPMEGSLNAFSCFSVLLSRAYFLLFLSSEWFGLQLYSGFKGKNDHAVECSLSLRCIEFIVAPESVGNCKQSCCLLVERGGIVEECKRFHFHTFGLGALSYLLPCFMVVVGVEHIAWVDRGVFADNA